MQANNQTVVSHGLMQQWPLTVDKLLTHAARWHGHREIVSRIHDGSIERCTYELTYRRARQLSNALLGNGVQLGDRVATLAMNSAAHLQTWYGIMGIGAICHTLNPRLFEEQLVYIINHAGDRWIFSDGAFAPLLARLLPKCSLVKRVTFFSAPQINLPGVRTDLLDDLLAGQSDDCRWGDFDEQTAAGLCYTSGTTGDPKGVLYSHRSNLLHTFITMSADVFGISTRDVVMPVVPMFHANAWGLAFSAPAVGCKLVLPGPLLDGASLHKLLEQEQVTLSGAVPTLWQGLLQHLTATRGRLTSLQRVLIGGAACPPTMIRQFQEEFGVAVIHAWGMTEMSPIGTVAALVPESATLNEDQRLTQRAKQGRVPFGIDMRLRDDAGAPVPHDGRAQGHLQVCGPAVARAYYARDAENILDTDGCFDTGDIGSIDELGYLRITDRAKDVIKSGGEWISSIEIENIAVAHPAVALAAVIGVASEQWSERPLLLIKLRPGAHATSDEIREFLEGKIARWWIPERVEFVDDIPLGATGKIDKKLLRKQIATVARDAG